MDTGAGADDLTPQEKNNPTTGEKRKREMKTPYQLEVLEQCYAAEAYPSESTRAELSEKIGLSDRQIQMWFCHRRLKDRKMEPNKRAKLEEESNVVGQASSSYSSSGQTRRVVFDAVPVAPPQLSAVELRIIAMVEAQIGQPLREDGPTLGVEFEPLPPGAFGAPIAVTPQQNQLRGTYNSQLFERDQAMPIKTSVRVPHDYQVPYMQPPTRLEKYKTLTKARLHDSLATNSSISAHIGLHTDIVSGDPHSSNKIRKVLLDNDSPLLERKQKSNDARFQNKIEGYEQCTRKETDKQYIVNKKREEQIRREAERLNRERRKEEERMLREKLREQERLLREQRRESERREKFLQKENQRAEKLRLKEEMRREKEEARLKAASERAKARKIAKGDMELIEDGRLELMESAASHIGLTSINALDNNTVQRLDMFRDNLGAFPPKSLQLKRPFATKPWTKSEENIANFLMAWKFLITFTDIFGLYPFTMDEFFQSLHDYDSKLLGDIHVALLKCVIKDIEDVARTSTVPLAANQISVSNGGHPQIIEGAFKWGFNIHSWQNHLNLLTWPEILRQFALSAGFGPQLKKQTVERLCLGDDNEGDNNEDIISKLRSGMAAENAVTRMHEKGYSLGRKSRHRMTPGTLKFAAFHVLSLEGSKGLTIVQVAEKIQRYGLRDLTTSRTPEASIGVALSRDTRLFERTAPSTYRVRSPFRKDPSDADNLLSTARQQILASQNGLVDLEQAEKEVDDAIDAEINEDFECYGDEDVTEIDILCTQQPTNHRESPSLVDGKLEVDIKPNVQGVGSSDVTGPDIDDSNLGEPWVQALTTGEYSDLSVEERLNALVALINVAVEGNSIRVILEERFEAAYAQKKQMWADSQLGRRRSRDEHLSKEEPAFVNNDQNNFNNIKELCTNPESNLPQLNSYAAEKSCLHLKSYIGYKAEQLFEYRCLPLGQDRRHNRYWLFSISASPNEKGTGRIFFESIDGFWRIIDTEEAFDALLAALDTRGIRESHLHYMMQRIEPAFKEAVKRNKKCTNFENLDTGTVKAEVFSPDLVECSKSFSIDSDKNDTERGAIINRYNVFVDAMWKECYNPALWNKSIDKRRCPELMQTCHLCYCCYLSEERHCPSCHRTFKSIYNLDMFFLEHASHCEGKQIMDPDWMVDVLIEVQLLKAQLCLLEASIPAEVLQPFWDDGYRNSWGKQLHASKSADDLLRLVTLLEYGIKRDYLSTNSVAKEQSDSSPSRIFLGNDGTISGTISTPPWIPTTTAAVALRILDLGASIFSKINKREEKETADLIKPSSRFSSVNNTVHDTEPSCTPEQAEHQSKMRSLYPGSGRIGRGRAPRGRGGRPRGSRGGSRGGRMARETGSTSAPSFTTQPNSSIYRNSQNTFTKRGRTRGRGRKKGQWGRCSIMPRQMSEGRFGNFSSAEYSFRQDNSENSPRSYVGNNQGTYVEEGNSSEENEMISGDEFDVDTPNYGIKPMVSSDDYSEEDDLDGYEIQNNRTRIGNQGMDDDMDEDNFDGTNAGEEDYSSEYSE